MGSSHAYRSSGTAPVWVLFKRYNTSGTELSSTRLPWERFPDKNLLFMAHFPWATAPTRAFSRVGSPWGHRQHMPVVVWGPSWPSGWVSVHPPFSMCCRAISALASGAPYPCPLHLLHWCLCLQGCVLCQTFLLLSHRCCSIFLNFLKYVIMEALPTSLISSALDSNWNKFCQTREQLLSLLTETISASPLLPNPCQVNPAQCQVLWYLSGTTYGLVLSCSPQDKEFKPGK